MNKKTDWIKKSKVLEEFDAKKTKVLKKLEEKQKQSAFYAGQCSGIDLCTKIIKNTDIYVIDNGTSDGSHTFGDLYKQRAIFLSVIAKAFPDISWKSKMDCEGNEVLNRFLVGFDTSDGQATFHVDFNKYWDLFDCAELEKAKPFDGHTSSEAIKRIMSIMR